MPSTSRFQKVDMMTFAVSPSCIFILVFYVIISIIDSQINIEVNRRTVEH